MNTQNFSLNYVLNIVKKMSGRFVLIPLKTFKELCSSTKKSNNKITGVIQNWKNADQPEKIKQTKK